jgi:hypothetical protein
MTEREARNLKLRDRVYRTHVLNAGTIVERGTHALTIEWDGKDGRRTVMTYAQMRDVHLLTSNLYKAAGDLAAIKKQREHE